MYTHPYNRMVFMGIWPYTIVGAGYEVYRRLLLLYLVIYCKVCEAGSQEEKMVVKCKKQKSVRTSEDGLESSRWIGTYKDKLQPAPLPPRLQLQRWQCFAGSAGSVHYPTKHKPGWGVGESTEENLPWS